AVQFAVFQQLRGLPCHRTENRLRRRTLEVPPAADFPSVGDEAAPAGRFPDNLVQPVEGMLRQRLPGGDRVKQDLHGFAQAGYLRHRSFLTIARILAQGPPAFGPDRSGWLVPVE